MNVFRFIAGLLLAVATISIEMIHRNQAATGTSGTLVVVVPANNGIAVSADSRSITFGARCDDSVKLSVPAARDYSIIAATGTSTWINARIPLWQHDPCGDLKKNGVVFLDSKALAVSYVERVNLPIWKIDIEEFAREITQAIIAAAQLYPEYVRGFAGRNMFQLVLVAYDGMTATSYVRAVQFNLTEKFAIEAVKSSDATFTSESQPDYPHFGDTDNYTARVMLGDGRRFLPSSFREVESKIKISEVPLSLALDLSSGLINAAIETSKIDPLLYSIGGEVRTFQITSDGVRQVH